MTHHIPSLRSALAALAGFLVLAQSAAASYDKLPEYALTYAPHTFIASDEEWWPSDIATHVQHMVPQVDFTILGAAGSMALTNLSTWPSNVYMTSADDVESKPEWLVSAYGKPDNNGYSDAPATIVAAEKPGGVLDVFYFYFHSYNRGNKVLGIQFGDHVGDWEHSMIRFVHGEPQYIYYSEHAGGSAYNFSVVSFIGRRPIVYSAFGSHANYPTAGTQEYTPAGPLLTDHTSSGFYWDITKNYRGFWFNHSTKAFSVANGASAGGAKSAIEGADWLQWMGFWGDEQMPMSDPRQRCIDLIFVNDCRYEAGPTGPIDKNLGRTTVCQDERDCYIHSSVNEISIISKM